MTDQEKAQRLLDRASRRLCGWQLSLLQDVVDGENLRGSGQWYEGQEKESFEQLCTEFATDLQ